MNTHADKTTENKSNAVGNDMAVQLGAEHETFKPEDNRPEAIAQRKIQEAANNSANTKQLKAIKTLANNSAQVKQLKAVQAMVNGHAANTIQFVRDLPPGTHVLINGSTTGQIVNTRAAEYDIRIGGTDTVKTYPENVITLHPTIKAMRDARDTNDGGSFGDEILVDMHEFRRSKAPMYTTGLANCIAVVAFHRGTEVAAFTHYHTINCFDIVSKEDEDSGDTKDEAILNETALEALKARLQLTLGINSGVTFYIALGGMWDTTDVNTLKLKNQLLPGLNKIFAPTTMIQVAKVAHWDPTFGRISA